MKSASVTVDGELVSTIGKGLLIFAALSKEDTVKEAQSMASKVLKAKLWDGEDGKKWNCNVQDIEGEVLCGTFFSRPRSVLLSQFSRHVRPSWCHLLMNNLPLMSYYTKITFSLSSLAIHPPRVDEEREQAQLPQSGLATPRQGAIQ